MAPSLDRAIRYAVGGTLLGALLAGAVGFCLPKWYQSQLAVVPVAGSKMPSALASVAAAAGGLGELAAELGGGGSDANRIEAVLKSRTVSDAVINKFHLQARYRERHLENARRALWHHCHVRIDKKPGVVSLTCEDRDPALAQAITAYFGEVGNQTFVRVSASSAAAERKFLEKRVGQARRDVDGASARLRQFQEAHKVIDLGEQSKAVVSAMANLKGELMSKQIELSYLNSFSAPDEASSVQLRQQVAILERKLKTLEEAPGMAGVAPTAKSARRQPPNGDGIFPTALSVPKLRFELEQLMREQKIQETVFLLLTQRFEMAKINEARDTPAFQILDDPVVPTIKSRPKRSLYVLGGAFFGFLAGLGLLLWPRYRSLMMQSELMNVLRS